VRSSTTGNLIVAGLPKKGAPRSLIAVTVVGLLLLALVGLWLSQDSTTAAQEPALADEASAAEEPSEVEPPLAPPEPEAASAPQVTPAEVLPPEANKDEAETLSDKTPDTVAAGVSQSSQTPAKPRTSPGPSPTRAPKPRAVVPVAPPEPPVTPAPKPGRSGSISPQDL
jgi:hypothetical protein